ncbi:uveal autoantigen with coiled-coil domains and ankyrin repeats isoform X2 [Hypanus sabinus]|uniref:uveal autoantigen with coiled-coil domains and ankyrin repeats isoform X2 n=1 Tax=Hypanus sabinus TaxID=79690 RepID=UPI0028C4C58C|nr:uveal autoantigen with coiled-coil domains and ankyrin repeats isoform X2 [Hypanus sabinus]
MKSLKSRLKKHEVTHSTLDWSKYDDRLLKAVEKGDVDKVTSVLAKRGVTPTKLDVEGRSAFHVAAAKGDVPCINAMLSHGVDVAATDAAGRSVLHLTAKSGQSLCLQRLLQQDCPVDTIDHEGKSALHDAAVAGCASCVKLLLDHGAVVNVKDQDGRTPLLLAAQACHPAACRLLLDRGAEINSRDKESRTALMLGCKSGCKEVVEVLLNHGADVSLTDQHGHQCVHYAQLSKIPEVLTLIRAAVEKTVKARESSMKLHLPSQAAEMPQKLDARHHPAETSLLFSQKEQRSIKELQSENEDLKGKLKKLHHEQKIFLERVSGLQKQLNQECKSSGELQNEKQQLKNLLKARDREQEDNLKMLENLKAKLKTYETGHLYEQMTPGIQVAKELAPKEVNLPSVESQQTSTSAVSSNDKLLTDESVAGEHEGLKKDLEIMRRMLEMSKKEKGSLQQELLSRSKQCDALREECDRVKQESEEQIGQLEDALSDVQKRMFESEGKVKVLQAHVIALKEHLSKQGSVGSGRAVEELRNQLREVKAKHEEAVANVERLQHQIRLGTLQIEESAEVAKVEQYRREVEELQKAVSTAEQRKQEAERRASGLESELKSVKAKLSQYVPAEEFENMRNSFLSTLEEKEKKVASVQSDYERAQLEVTQLQKDLEQERAQTAACVKAEQYQLLRRTLESQSGTLTDVTQKHQRLQKENEAVQQENAAVKAELEELTLKLKTHYVPLTMHDTMKSSLNQTIEDLNKQVSEASQRYKDALTEAETLKVERDALSKNLNHVTTQYIPAEKHKEEITALNSIVGTSKTELEDLSKKYGQAQQQTENVLIELAAVKDSLKNQYVSLEKHEKLKSQLNTTSEKATMELSAVRQKCSEVEGELAKRENENRDLKEQLAVLQGEVQKDYVSLQLHEEMKAALSRKGEELQMKIDDLQLNYRKVQEEVAQLNKERESQVNKLQALQESISSQFVPMKAYEENQDKFNATVTDLNNQLSEKTQQCSAVQEQAEGYKAEMDELGEKVRQLEESLECHYISKAVHEEMEDKLVSGMREKTEQVEEVKRKFVNAEVQNEKLQAENARLLLTIHKLEEKIESEHILVEEFETMKRSLGERVTELQEEQEKMKESWAQEQAKVASLLLELDDQKKNSLPLQQHNALKEKLQEDIARLKCQVNEREEEMKEKVLEISRLQVDTEAMNRTIEELKARQVLDLSEHERMKASLEAQVNSLSENLASLKERHEKMSTEVLRAKEKELSAKDEKETFQSRTFSFEQEVKELKNKYDESMATICDLQKSIQESAKQIEAKDNRITELLNDVERLKQALNGLSQLSYSAGNTKRPSQQMEALQNQVKTLEQRLADADRQHREVIAIYRTHLLNAAQGHMDEDVQAALLQIIRMRQEFVC